MEQIRNAAAQFSKALANTNAKITALEKQQAQGRPGDDAPGRAARAAGFPEFQSVIGP